MKLIIDRKIWLRGEGAMKSKLLRSTDDKMCCIGIYCEALGVPKNELLDHSGSQVLDGEAIGVKLPDWIQPPAGDSEGDLFSAYEINDDNGTRDYEREKDLTEIFARHDVEVEFID
jgi:hypothetical protein